MKGAQPGEVPGESTCISQDIAFLEKFGVSKEVLWWCQTRSERLGVSPATVLLANGLVAESDYFRCVAHELDLAFTSQVASHGQPYFNPPHPDDLSRMSRMIQIEVDHASGVNSQFSRKQLCIAPDCTQLDAIKHWLFINRAAGSRLKIAPLSVNRAALEERCSQGLFAQAVDGLRRRFPSLSAHRVITPKQAVTLFLIFQLLVVLAFFSTPSAFLLLHLTATSLYLGCIALRLGAAATFDRKTRVPPQPGRIHRIRDQALPIYSILVPLFGEHGQVGDLVSALSKIDWPKERLEIKLICESEDEATVIACRETLAALGCNHMAVVVVPAGQPQTKPKALAYTLPLCRGTYVVVYDAEDRPDPLQLREAFSIFKSGTPDLACLQAPLVIHNNTESWLSRMFAIEYSALFDGLIPALARWKTPVPLGGTSNHFRRAVLDSIGGWDPHNVTEDADLGVRLARAGYRTGTLTRPTYEEAPILLTVWIKQRTRWFKGWYQTWLVHMRQPVKTMSDLGVKNSIVFQLMIAGMAISALVHPLLIYFIITDIMGYMSSGRWRSAAGPMFMLDITTVVLGYLSFVWLAWRTLPVRKLTHLRFWLFGVPLYWLLLSISAWRALWQLLRRPHFWEKTPHGLSRKTLKLTDR